MMGASNDFPIFWSIKAAVTELDPYWDNLHLLYTQLLVWGPNFLNPESPIDTPFWLSHQRISTTKLRDNFLPHTNILQSRLFNHGFLSLYKIHSAISNNITAEEYTHKKVFFVSIIAILKFMVAETVDDIGIHTRGLNTVILEMVWGQKIMVNSNIPILTYSLNEKKNILISLVWSQVPEEGYSNRGYDHIFFDQTIR